LLLPRLAEDNRKDLHPPRRGRQRLIERAEFGGIHALVVLAVGHQNDRIVAKRILQRRVRDEAVGLRDRRVDRRPTGRLELTGVVAHALEPALQRRARAHCDRRRRLWRRTEWDERDLLALLEACEPAGKRRVTARQREQRLLE